MQTGSASSPFFMAMPPSSVEGGIATALFAECASPYGWVPAAPLR